MYDGDEGQLWIGGSCGDASLKPEGHLYKEEPGGAGLVISSK